MDDFFVTPYRVCVNYNLYKRHLITKSFKNRNIFLYKNYWWSKFWQNLNSLSVYNNALVNHSKSIGKQHSTTLYMSDILPALSLLIYRLDKFCIYTWCWFSKSKNNQKQTKWTIHLGFNEISLQHKMQVVRTQ